MVDERCLWCALICDVFLRAAVFIVRRIGGMSAISQKCNCSLLTAHGMLVNRDMSLRRELRYLHGFS